MSDQCYISVIVPVYNSKKFIKKSIESVINQNFSKNFEIIVIDDASTDDSLKIIKSINNPKVKIFSLPQNSGPAAARNLGIKKAIGDYVFFLDADDTIHIETLKSFYQIAVENKYDYIFCDHEWIQNGENQRKSFFSYNENREISKENLIKEMKQRVHNPVHMGGPLSSKGKLIKRSLIINNKIFFEEKLRYLEDEIFMWDILGNVRAVKYLKKQYYTYNVNPNISSAVSRGINNEFSVEKFKIIREHIKNSFKLLGVKDFELKKLGDQALIYFIINVLISYSKSIIQKKVEIKTGKNILKNLISNIINDQEVSDAIKNYKISKYESIWIPRLISIKFAKLVEIACFIRAKKIIKIRKNN